MLTCLNCHWSGDLSELVAVDDDVDNFSYCPRCDGDIFEEEEE